LAIAFSEMPAEALGYENDFFDLIVARDILHHVDIVPALSEIRRVARPGALFLVNEIYSHSFTDRVRHSVLVEKMLYPRMQRFIYGPGQPYITEDERKLTETDLREITKPLHEIAFKTYFNFLVTRVIPDTYTLPSQLDRLFLILFKPLAPLLAGRIILAGPIAK
jgi:ubiquinone/menaquinone biosynthesis C-methylase UbiE